MSKLLAAIVLAFTFGAHAEAGIKTTWKKVKVRKHVEVFKGEIPGSPVVAFRGVGTIDAPIANVVSVIHDVTRMKEWISDFHSSRVLKQVSTFEKIEYNRTKTPWPLSDRDFIYSVKVNVNKSENSVDVLINDASHAQTPPVKDVVRGKLHQSRYYIKKLDDNKTHIEVEIFADPKGKIPKWIVNLFQSVWPSNTIDGIRKIAEEPGYRVHPDVASYIKNMK